MRTIKELINDEKIKYLINSGKHVYVYLGSRAIRYRFMSDAEREGITYGDGVKPTERHVGDIMALKPCKTICYPGWAGHMCYSIGGDSAIRIDYEKFIDGMEDYIINKQRNKFN